MPIKSSWRGPKHTDTLLIMFYRLVIKMKKMTLLASLIMTMGATSMAQAASSGTINFTGQITDTTCTVTVNGGSGADGTVALPTVGTAALTTAAQTAGTVNFHLTLTDCTAADGMTSGTVFYESGATVNGTTGNLIQQTAQADGGATNVELQLLDGKTGSAIKVGDSSQLTSNSYVTLPAAGGSIDIPYSVQYYATGATTAGPVTSSVEYSISYK